MKTKLNFSLIATLICVGLAAVPAHAAEGAQPADTDKATLVVPQEALQTQSASFTPPTSASNQPVPRGSPPVAANPDDRSAPAKVQRPDFSLANMRR